MKCVDCGIPIENGSGRRKRCRACVKLHHREYMKIYMKAYYRAFGKEKQNRKKGGKDF